MRGWLVVILSLLGFCAPVWAEPDFSTPQATFESYLEACREGDFEGADLCYTASSREYIASHPRVTEGRSPESLKVTYQRLSQAAFKLEQVNSRRAIIRFEDQGIPPYFLRVQKAGEGWRIDWHFMSHYIRRTEDGWSWTFSRAERIWKSRK